MHDGNGIKLYKDTSEILLTWNQVEKRISELIKLERYLNDKEKTEYFNWLKKQEQEKELQKVEEELETQTEQHYEYHLGDTVYIGADKYEIASIKDNVVTLIDTKFPIMNKQMDFNEFEKKVKDNYSNDHLIVKEQIEKTVEIQKNSYSVENIEDEVEKQEIKTLQVEKPYKIGQKVYLESDRVYNIYNIDLEKDKIELQDLQMSIPIFREENILTFENLYNQNERNFPKQDIKPNFVKTKNKIQDFVLHPEVALENKNNYRIIDNDLGIGTPREKFKRNIEAIKILKKCEQEDRYATLEEQEILSKYVGWGGLQQAFDENDSSWLKEYDELKELLTDDEYKSARASTLTAFYTPPVVIKAIYRILQNMGLKEANILEPSCRYRQFYRNVTSRTCKLQNIWSRTRFTIWKNSTTVISKIYNSSARI